MNTKRVHVHEVYGKPMDIKEAEFEDINTPPISWEKINGQETEVKSTLCSSSKVPSSTF